MHLKGWLKDVYEVLRDVRTGARLLIINSDHELLVFHVWESSSSNKHHYGILLVGLRTEP